MSKSVEVGQINGRLSVRLFGEEKWSPIRNKSGKFSIQFNKDLKKELGFKKEEIVEKNYEQNSEDQKRIEELERDLEREDISQEVRNTTITEIRKLKEGINERVQENEGIQNQTVLKERIKKIFKKYGFTLTAVASSVGVIIGVIVSNLSSGLSKMARGIGNGLKDIGKKLGQILPDMVGAIVSFIFRTAGEVVGFLAKNAWLLVLAVVLYFVESLKKKK